MGLSNAKEFRPVSSAPEYLKLKPCPFCGSEDVSYFNYDHAAGERWGVVCLGCMAQIDPGWAQSMIAVQELWNKRSF